jgi:hypothetical protein
MTQREALALEGRYGGRWVGDVLLWVEVTSFGDAEPQWVLQTPRCAYCGQPAPFATCVHCGASALRDGPV